MQRVEVVGGLGEEQPGPAGRFVKEYADVEEHLKMFPHVGFFFGLLGGSSRRQPPSIISELRRRAVNVQLSK
jgi:hypothetical protein